jgi:hypothetical protein
MTLVIASVANVVAALLMLLVLRPLRVRAIHLEEALRATASD